jgi:hypothetical protein
MGNTQYGNGHVTLCPSGVTAPHHAHSWLPATTTTAPCNHHHGHPAPPTFTQPPPYNLAHHVCGRKVSFFLFFSFCVYLMHPTPRPPATMTTAAPLLRVDSDYRPDPNAPETTPIKRKKKWVKKIEGFYDGPRPPLPSPHLKGEYFFFLFCLYLMSAPWVLLATTPHLPTSRPVARHGQRPRPHARTATTTTTLTQPPPLQPTT